MEKFAKVNVSAFGVPVYHWDESSTKPSVHVTFAEDNDLFYFEEKLTLKEAKELRNQLKAAIADAEG